MLFAGRAAHGDKRDMKRAMTILGWASVWASLSLAACSTPATTTGADDAASADTATTDADDADGALADTADTAESDLAADVPAWDPSAMVPHTPGAAAKGELLAGVAERALDGPVGVSMGGYGGRFGGAKTPWSDALNGSRGFYGHMRTKVVALQVGTERLAIVKSPLLTSESTLTDAVARALLEKYKLDLRGRVLMSAGHSHHATARFWPIPPELSAIGLDSFDPEVTDRIAYFFADAIAEAFQNAAPAEWAWQSFEDWDPNSQVYRDRRDDNNPTYGKDPRLMLVGVRKKAGAMLALVMSLPIHGTAFGGDNDLLTEDAPGAVEHKVEDAWFAQYGTPVMAMLMQSAGGDASPSGDSLGHPTPARLEKLGEDAAGLVLPLAQKLTYKGTMELSVRGIRRDFDYAHMYAAADVAHEFELEDGTPYTWGGWQCKADNVKDGESMAGHPKQCIDLGIFVSAMGVAMPFAELSQVILSAARLDDLALITLPGEPTYSIVKYARQAVEGKIAGVSKLMVLGYSQDYFLYLTAPDDWMVGGYESQMSLWGPAGGRYFTDTSIGLLTDLMAGNTLPTWWESSANLATPYVVTKRPTEKSENAGTLLVGLPSEATRGQTLDVQLGAGDPGLGAPHAVVERLEAGKWTAVAAKNGHVGAVYDNTRYEMMTIYEPIPGITRDLLPQRKHQWRVRWQVPMDWPAGTYRLHVTATALGLDGKPVAVDLSSQTHISGGAVAVASKISAGKATLTWRAQPIAYQQEPDFTWPKAGWRLTNRDVGPSQEAPVRVALQVTGPGQPTPLVVPWNEAAGGCVIDLPTQGWNLPVFLKVDVAGSEGPGLDVTLTP